MDLQAKPIVLALDPRHRGLGLTSLGSQQAYQQHRERVRHQRQDNRLFERRLLPARDEPFGYRGYCHNCRTMVDLEVDFQHAYPIAGVLTPNWRERLECPRCRLNNRMRAVQHLFDLQCRPQERASIYITEQTTPLYRAIKSNHPHTKGSEYLGDTIDHGRQINGIRHESLTNLSFKSNRFQHIICCDVLEHIPNYKQALSECNRCLKPGGTLLLTVPFSAASATTIVRAQRLANGAIEHLLPPEYHGDPINPKGCLCFYHFGWDILDHLRQAGFDRPHAQLVWSKRHGYLGDDQFVFIARKHESRWLPAVPAARKRHRPPGNNQAD